MSDREYEQFFNLLTDIVNGDGNWESKKEVLLAHAADQSDLGVLLELASWFNEG